MNPLIISILATLFVIIGTCAVFIMLEMTGRVRDNSGKTAWRSIHKKLGWIFIVLFMVMLAVMIQKVSVFQEELTARAVIHIILALILIPLILFKVLIVRRHRRFSNILPVLGVTILTLSFALTGITAGYYVLHRSNLSYTTLSAMDADILDVELGKATVSKKCSKCHSLERVYRAFKSDVGWAGTVNRMALLDSPNITSFDVKQSINYLVEQQKIRQKKNGVNLEKEIGQTLVTRKCSVCHDLDKVFDSEKNAQEWTATVKRMAATMDDPEFLSEQETADIVKFLSGRLKE